MQNLVFYIASDAESLNIRTYFNRQDLKFLTVKFSLEALVNIVLSSYLSPSVYSLGVFGPGLKG